MEEKRPFASDFFYLVDNRPSGIWSDTIVAREYWMIYRRPGFLFVVWFGYSMHPNPLPVFRQQPRPATHRKTEKERQLADGSVGGGGGAKSYNIENAWRPQHMYIYDVNIHIQWTVAFGREYPHGLGVKITTDFGLKNTMALAGGTQHWEKYLYISPAASGLFFYIFLAS